MRSNFYLALSALVTLAVADKPNAFNIPNGGYSFKVGEATTLKWTPYTHGTVSLKLQSGEVSTPDSGSTIASHIENSGSYTWTPSKDIENKSDYTIEIVDDSNSEESNYLPRFSVAGATAGTSSTSAASSTASSSASTSTESSTTASPSTMTTVTSTTSSPSTTAASTTGASSTASNTSSITSSTETSSGSPSTSSSASAAGASATDTSAGMVNRVSGGMMAIVLGAIALI